MKIKKNWKSQYRLALALLFLLAGGSIASGVTLGQIDDFQNGLTAGWSHGQLNPDAPRIFANDGPDGIGDFALTVSSKGGGGAGSRLIMFNRDQWTGDFLNAGVTAFQFDVRHNSGVDAFVRFAIDGPGGRFAIIDPVVVSSTGSGEWTTHSFELELVYFQHLSGGSGSFAATLAGVTEARVLSSANPSWLGDSVEASLSFDNIQAIPEPGAYALLAGVCAMGFLLWRRRTVQRGEVL